MRIKIPQMNVMRLTWPALAMSLLLCLISIGAVVVNGLNLGLEFTGGSTIEVQYAEAADTGHVRSVVQTVHPDANVVQYGSSRDLQIRFADLEGEDSTQTSEKIITALQADQPSMRVQGQSRIGGQYKEELLEKGMLALVFACLGILVYIALRFEKKFALAAVVSQVHDVLITLGAFALFQWQFDLTVVAALLAILGYSVNDTVVVFDRIRENFVKLPSRTPYEVINISICQTLARTIVTSLTTLLAVIALLLFGGQTMHGFSVAMCIGIVFGTYSSIYVASGLAYKLGIRHADMLPKEKKLIDDLP